MSNLKTERFTRKPFEVEAVRITTENFEDVRAWCEGVASVGQHGPFFKVDVKRPLTERQTRAHIGDWILFAGNGFKVYTNNAFREFFIPVRAGVQIINTPRTKPDVFPGEPKEMTEELPFNVVDRVKPSTTMEKDITIPTGWGSTTVPVPKPGRPLTVVKTAKNTGRPIGFNGVK